MRRTVIEIDCENPQEYIDMVQSLRKKPEIIQGEITPLQIDLLHAAVGISGEAGELLDQIKKHVIYQRLLDYNNVVEELGDLEFYMEQIRQAAGISRTLVLEHNKIKLQKRYPEGFTNIAAQDRADKIRASQPIYVDKPQTR